MHAGVLNEMISMPKLDNETVLIFFVIVAAAALLMQAILLLVVVLSVRKAARAIVAEVEGLRSAAMPIIYNTREFLARVMPKIEETVEDISEITYGVRLQTAEAQSTVAEILERLRNQSRRMESIFSKTLDAVDSAGKFVNETVNRPVRQLSGILSAVRAVVESLRSKRAQPR